MSGFSVAPPSLGVPPEVLEQGHAPIGSLGVEGPYVTCRRCGKTGVALVSEPCGIPDAQPAPPAGPELTKAEELGLVVAAAYGQALAERDMAVGHLRSLLAVIAPTSFAATNAAEEAARAWLEEYDTAQAVRSPETPEQETTGP